jgi:hypothetical protein
MVGTGRQDNLIPNSERTPEELRSMTKKGGINSGIARRKKKTFAELAKAMMDCKPTETQLKMIKEVFPDLEIEEVTNRALMIQKQMDKAVTDGDTKAFEVLRDTIGEKPSDKLEMTGRDGEPLNMKYELAPATKKAIEEQKKEREVLDE